MRLSTRPEHAIPIYLAALSPAMLRLTGEIADGWLGTSFVPEGAGDAYFAHLDAGLAAAGRTRADIDICQGAEVAFAADEDELQRHGRRPQEGTRVQPRRHGIVEHELLQPGLQPAGLGRGRGRGARALAAAATATARPGW